MLGELKAAPLLRRIPRRAKGGCAGAGAIDRADLAARRARFAERAQSAEIEINPVLVHGEGKGVTIVDALVVRGSKRRVSLQGRVVRATSARAAPERPVDGNLTAP